MDIKLQYLILDAKASVGERGLEPPVVASVLYSKNGGSPIWLHCFEYMGIPCFYRTSEDIHNKLANDESQDFWDEVNEKFALNEFDGLPLGEYNTIFEGIDSNLENLASCLLRYIILLVRCESEKVEEYVETAKGKYVETINIKFSDVENDYRGLEGEDDY